MEFALAAIFTALGSVVAVLATLTLEKRRYRHEIEKESLRLLSAERVSERELIVGSCADFLALVTAHGNLLHEKARLLSKLQTDAASIERRVQIEREIRDAHNAKMRPLFFIRLHSTPGLEESVNRMNGWIYALRDHVESLEAGDAASYDEDHWDTSYVEIRVNLMREVALILESLEIFDGVTIGHSKTLWSRA